MNKKARELSVGNLQRLYTIVMSLAVAESLRRLLSDFGDGGQVPDFASVVAVLSLLVTVIPFYHGANRYLEATYITGERKTKVQALMLDFITLFAEGLLFLFLAVMIRNTEVFFTVLAILFVLDSVWVGVTSLAHVGIGGATDIRAWAVVNILAAMSLLLLIWWPHPRGGAWPSSIALSGALGATAFVRTIVDYKAARSFYVPSPVAHY
jgi:hypothetical protein